MPITRASERLFYLLLDFCYVHAYNGGREGEECIWRAYVSFCGARHILTNTPPQQGPITTTGGFLNMFRWKEHEKELVEFVEAATLLGFSKQNALEAWVAKHNYETTYNSAMVVYYRERKKYLPQIDPASYEMPLEDLDLLYKAQKGELNFPTPAKESSRRDDVTEEMQSDRVDATEQASEQALEELPEKEVVPQSDLETNKSSTDVAQHERNNIDLNSVIDRIQKLGKDNPQVPQYIAHMSMMLGTLIEEERRRIREEETRKFQVAFDRLKKDVDRHIEQVRARLDEQHRAYEALDALVTEFASLRTIDAVTALRDYRNRMVTEVDKFNNVLKVTDQWTVEFENQLKQLFSNTERRILAFKPRERQASA